MAIFVFMAKHLFWDFVLNSKLQHRRNQKGCARKKHSLNPFRNSKLSRFHLKAYVCILNRCMACNFRICFLISSEPRVYWLPERQSLKACTIIIYFVYVYLDSSLIRSAIWSGRAFLVGTKVTTSDVFRADFNTSSFSQALYSLFAANKETNPKRQAYSD